MWGTCTIREASGSISLALIPRFNELLINWVGWRHAWHIIGAIALLGLAPVLGFFIRNRPEDVGEKPDGHDVGKRLRRPSLLVDAEDDWTVREAHDCMDRIEEDLQRRFPGTEILIHLDPEGHTDRETMLSSDLTESST